MGRGEDESSVAVIPEIKYAGRAEAAFDELAFQVGRGWTAPGAVQENEAADILEVRRIE